MKKILSLVLTLAMLATMCVFGGTTVSAAATQWGGEAATAFSGGNGTAVKPYQIGTAAELKLFANIVNGEGGQTQDATICGILTADIVLNVGDVSGCGGTKADGWFDWSPIGTGSDYLGTFNGDGHTVSGVYYNDENKENVGFFGTIGAGATVSNLGVVNSYIQGDSKIGGVCGRNDGEITDCYNAGMANGYSNVGGVCGYSTGTVTYCYNTGAISGQSECGGVCGFSEGAVTGCYNTGAVSVGNYIGGVCGFNTGRITACYNTGTVSGGMISGGVCMMNYSIITGCYYLDTCGAGGEGTPKTANEMKTQAFVNLLNSNGGSFTYYIGKLPFQNWQPDPNIYGTAVTYDVAPDYIVTIPEEVTLGGTATVSAENVVLDEGKQLNIALTGTSGNDNAFTVSNGKTATLAYRVTDSSENTILLGGNVLTVNPSNASSGSAELKFTKPADNSIIYSGEYTGTVTFTVSVAG